MTTLVGHSEHDEAVGLRAVEQREREAMKQDAMNPWLHGDPLGGGSHGPLERAGVLGPETARGTNRTSGVPAGRLP